jgi:DNA ligase 1
MARSSPGIPPNRPLPFAALQKRIGRKTVPKSLLTEAPAWILAYDLLEDAGQDLRDRPLAHRRARLEAIIKPPCRPACRWPPPPCPSRRLGRPRRHPRHRAREGAEGLMLKRAASPISRGASAATGGNGSSTR